jgi:hypothetical protein
VHGFLILYENNDLNYSGELLVSAQDNCQYLSISEKGAGCKLRKVLLSNAEAKAKCAIADLAVMCVDAYNALFKAQSLIKENSTDSFLWISESANQFENLQETDNAIHVIVRGINFAIQNVLIDKGYELFRYGRSMYEAGLERKDSSIDNPVIKQNLVKAGGDLVEKARKIIEGSDVIEMQAELKAAFRGGVQLQKATKEDEDESKIIIVDGRTLYEKKAKEYREGAQKYISSGMIGNAITFACMAALSELMLGRPKEGLVYLTKFVSDSNKREEFLENICFQWAKTLFTALIKRDEDAIQQANVIFFKIPWSFKDDREFARRVMDSVQRRLSS